MSFELMLAKMMDGRGGNDDSLRRPPKKLCSRNRHRSSVALLVAGAQPMWQERVRDLTRLSPVQLSSHLYTFQRPAVEEWRRFGDDF